MDFDKKHFLIVDDDNEILDLVKFALKTNGFNHIFTASSRLEATKIIDTQNIEFAILDIKLPDGNGYDILTYLRQKNQIPVLFLSALSDMENQYKGFDLGVDDYMTKPFLTKELIYRVKAILKRSYPSFKTHIQLPHALINFESGTIIKNDEEIPLTAKEYKILQLLCDNKNHILSIDTILDHVWGPESYGYDNTLMAHIRKIREKLENQPSSPKHLITVKGLGYKLVI